MSFKGKNARIGGFRRVEPAGDDPIHFPLSVETQHLIIMGLPSLTGRSLGPAATADPDAFPTPYVRVAAFSLGPWVDIRP